jgi:hypothetical protein
MSMASSVSGWRGPYAWDSGRQLFQGQPAAAKTHIEDAHMWIAGPATSNPGSFHAIFHSDVEGTCRGAAGGHAYSKDGVSWTFSPRNSFGNVLALPNGSTVTLRQRERPHLVFDAKGRMVALTNGAGLENSRDAIFTLAQLIRTA